MAKKLISFDDAKPGLGLPEPVVDRIDDRFALKGEALEPEAIDGVVAGILADPTAQTRGEVDALMTTTPLMVHHGDNPTVPRPDTDRVVMWIGSVVPAHRLAGDLVLAVESEPAPWSPAWLDLVAWYDASNGYTAGEQVTQIHDMSGHANHLTTLGGAGVITVGTTDLAHPGFRFNGDSWITSGTLPAGAWRHPTTIYLVANVEDQEVDAQTLIDGTTNSTRAALWKTKVRLLGMRQTIGVTSGTAAFTAGPHLIAGVFSGDGQSRGEIDGAVVLGPADVGTATPSAIRLGGSFQDTNGTFGSIGEVIIARDVSPEDHQKVTDHLMQKWGIA